jgi:hypothetical protein
MSPPAIGEKSPRYSGRQQQQRRGEDRRDDAGGVDLQRQMRAVAAYIFLPTWRLGYFIRSRRCARSTNTMPAITATAPGS